MAALWSSKNKVRIIILDILDMLPLHLHDPVSVVRMVWDKDSRKHSKNCHLGVRSIICSVRLRIRVQF